MNGNRDIVSATVCNIKQETPSTKSFDLVPTRKQIHFQPGQWVDFFVSIKGHQEVAGYSITSSPYHNSSVSLAVKDIGDDLVTRYIHDSMLEGDIVSLNIGGECTYNLDNGSTLLLAGGIGITPLISIFKYIGEATSHKALLFHSVSSSKEFLHQEEIKALCSQQPNRLFYKQTISRKIKQLNNVGLGRITKDTLQALPLSCFDTVFLCGPNQFISDLSKCLMEIGFNENQIHYEKWW